MNVYRAFVLTLLLLPIPATAESGDGFVSLFNGKDLTGWTGSTKGYEVNDGVLICPAGRGKGGNIYTAKQYENFLFDFEFKLTPGANNGVGLRTPLKGNPAKVAMESQILDNTAERYAKLQATQYHGSIYKRVAAKRGHLKPVGQWNTQRIIADGNIITVVLNGVKIIDAADITRHKRPVKGHIAFLGHGSHVEFRNIRIKTLPSASPRTASDRPNIIYILADDLGYGDIQCQNSDSKIPTPNIDRMAREGMRFTDLHTNSSVCSPTRYGIMTGRYSFRTWLQKGALSGYQKPLIAKDRMTVASLLKQGGYHTACIGKWHMGWDWAKKTNGERGVDFTKPFTGGPVDSGFDSFFGICASLDIPPYCYCRDSKVEKLPTIKVPAGVFGGRPGVADPDLKPEQAMLDLNAEITSLIKNHRTITKGKPLFVYYSLPAPHVPVAPAERFHGKTDVGKYGDYVYEVDWIVGEVLKALKDAGIDDNTLVTFTADNGASPTASSSAIRKGHKPNKPFRGGKASIWDGGHRVPFIARWPGRIKAEQVNDELFCTTDLLATCAEIIGKTLPENAGEDSISMLPAMNGSTTPQTRKGVIHHSVYGHFAIRVGDWKYMMTPGSGGWSGSLGMKRLPVDKNLPGQLYDMSQDIYEANNLVLKHPERVKQMKALLEEIVNSGRSTPGAAQPNDAKITIK